MGMIWMLYGDEEKEFNFSELQEIHQSLGSSFCETFSVWNSHITYCIENQLDYTHLPNVHKNTIGRGFKYPKDPMFVMSEEKIMISFHGKDPVLAFYFPNIWVLHVSNKMKLLVYFAPIDEFRTVFYLRSYHAILKYGLARFLISPYI